MDGKNDPEQNKNKNKKNDSQMSLEIHRTDISGLPIAPSVIKQIETKHKTEKEEHTHRNNTSILACKSLFRMDGQPQSIIRMWTSQRKKKMGWWKKEQVSL